MQYIKRHIRPKINRALERGKSVLLLGARQTGKTTLIKEQMPFDRYVSFADAESRQRYEKNSALLAQEIKAEFKLSQSGKRPLIVIDEVQKIPKILDVVQDLIDNKIAQFILTGSSARKLQYNDEINLLPGRVVVFRLDPLVLSEISEPCPDIKYFLSFGSLPGILTEADESDKELDLESYVYTYLEEEIRKEALVRDVGLFSRFLELAASESGNIVNFNKLSQEIGVSHNTIVNYYNILEDCLVAIRIDPLTKTKTRRRLTKSAKYVLFDLGIRRVCAHEGIRLSDKNSGFLFEQFVALELSRLADLAQQKYQLYFWRDHDGPEVDFVIERNGLYTPIEVKWTEIPSQKDIKHLKVFLSEYETTDYAYVVCRTTKRLLLDKNILAIPWQEISSIYGSMLIF